MLALELVGFVEELGNLAVAPAEGIVVAVAAGGGFWGWDGISRGLLLLLLGLRRLRRWRNFCSGFGHLWR